MVDIWKKKTDLTDFCAAMLPENLV